MTHGHMSKDDHLFANSCSGTSRAMTLRHAVPLIGSPQNMVNSRKATVIGQLREVGAWGLPTHMALWGFWRGILLMESGCDELELGEDEYADASIGNAASLAGGGLGIQYTRI